MNDYDFERGRLVTKNDFATPHLPFRIGNVWKILFMNIHDTESSGILFVHSQ